MSDFPYPGCFTFVDVEIPNLNNDCICAISIIVVENQKEVLRVTELINPRTFFSANNVRIHHIRRKDVANARTLPQFWKDYGKYFEKPYIIGAHNVMSDISVLNKDLARMKTRIQAEQCIDTMDIMENFYYHKKNEKGDLKLSNIAKKLNIEIDHHNPESDVNACYEIVRFMHNNLNMDLTPYIKPIRKTKIKPSKHKISPSQIQSYSLQAKRQIACQSSSTKMSLQTAQQKADEAYKHKDYEGTIFHYELLAAKNVTNPAIYLRLAEIYEKFSLNKEAIRILEKGIQALKQGNQNWKSLQQMQMRIRQKIAPKKRAESTAPIQSIDAAKPSTFSKVSPQISTELPSEPKFSSISQPKSTSRSLEKPVRIKSKSSKAGKRPNQSVLNSSIKPKSKENYKSLLESVRDIFRFGLKK